LLFANARLILRNLARLSTMEHAMVRSGKPMLACVMTPLVMLLVLAQTGLARAESGAIAVGSLVGCSGHGYSNFVAYNYPSQLAADEAARSGCARQGGEDCRIVMRFGAHQCGYVASTANNCSNPSTVAWGSSAAATLQKCETTREPSSGPCKQPTGACNP